MTFEEPELQAQYEHSVMEIGDPSDGLGEIRALAALHEWLQMLEGPHSLRVHATRDRLLSPDLRPVLQRWLHEPMNASTIHLRDTLSRSVEEELEDVAPV